MIYVLSGPVPNLDSTIEIYNFFLLRIEVFVGNPWINQEIYLVLFVNISDLNMLLYDNFSIIRCC